MIEGPYRPMEFCLVRNKGLLGELLSVAPGIAAVNLFGLSQQSASLCKRAPHRACLRDQSLLLVLAC